MRRALLPWGAGRAFADSGTGLLLRGRGCITSFSISEASGDAVADMTVYDGESANGLVLFDFFVLPAGTALVTWVPHAMPFEQGIYLDLNPGTAVGSVTAWVDHDCAEWLWVEHKTEVLTGAEALAQLTGAG